MSTVTERLAGLGAVAAAAAMVATPLRPEGRRAALTHVVVGGLATTTTALAARRWGWPRATAALAATAALTGAVERVGTATGFPFGRYAYGQSLQPQRGGVPLVVPAAWFAMAVPAREVAGRRAVLGAAALTAWDVFLDPQMVAEGHWRWTGGGRYRGIPATNFAGWFLTGLAAMALLDRLLPDDGGGPDSPLVAVYGAVGVMEALGFAAFFDDRLVAAAGTAAMGGAGLAGWAVARAR